MRGNAIDRSSFRSLFSGLLPLFVMAHCAHHLLTALPVPLLPMIRSEFGLDYTQSGFVVSAFSLAYGIGQLPAGWLADHIGRRTMITIGICGVAAAGLFIGLSQTYTMMIIFLALMGLMGGGYHPSAPPMISASVKPEKRGSALGLHTIGGGASYFLAPLIAAAIAAVWSWRGSFITLAVPTIIFGTVFYRLLGRLGDVKKAGHKTINDDSPLPPIPGQWRRLVPFIVLSTFTGTVSLSSISFIPLYLVDHFSVSQETAAAFISIIYFAGLWGGPVGGYLSDRLGRVPVMLTVCFITGPVIYLLNLAPFGLGISVLLILIGMSVYFRMPITESYIIGYTSEHNRSTILGIYYFGSMEGSGILTPIFGYMIDQLGFYTSFTIAGAALVVMTLACSMFLWGRRD